MSNENLLIPIGQMGFMMVEFALGLYPLVILHLMGHDFCKAYGFLSSGSRVIIPIPSLISKKPRIFLAMLSLLFPACIYSFTGSLEIGMIALFITGMIGLFPKNQILSGMLFALLLSDSS